MRGGTGMRWPGTRDGAGWTRGLEGQGPGLGVRMSGVGGQGLGVGDEVGWGDRDEGWGIRRLGVRDQAGDRDEGVGTGTRGEGIRGLGSGTRLGGQGQGWEDSVSSSDCRSHSIIYSFPFLPFPNIWDISSIT